MIIEKCLITRLPSITILPLSLCYPCPYPYPYLSCLTRTPRAGSVMPVTRPAAALTATTTASVSAESALASPDGLEHTAMFLPFSNVLSTARVTEFALMACASATRTIPDLRAIGSPVPTTVGATVSVTRQHVSFAINQELSNLLSAMFDFLMDLFSNSRMQVRPRLVRARLYGSRGTLPLPKQLFQ